MITGSQSNQYYRRFVDFEKSVPVPAVQAIVYYEQKIKDSFAWPSQSKITIVQHVPKYLLIEELLQYQLKPSVGIVASRHADKPESVYDEYLTYFHSMKCAIKIIAVFSSFLRKTGNSLFCWFSSIASQKKSRTLLNSLSHVQKYTNCFELFLKSYTSALASIYTLVIFRKCGCLLVLQVKTLQV